MRLSPVVLKLRNADTRFGNRIAGVAELNVAIENTLTHECAFVLQIAEFVPDNAMDLGLNQKINERFAVVVALKNDDSDRDKLGLTAYDTLYDVRSEIFRGILGWQMDDAESWVYYGGGRIIRMNRGWLWYQFEFQVDTRITESDGVDVEGDAGGLSPFNMIHTEYVLSPSVNASKLPIFELPLTAFAPDMTTIVDLTTDLDAGSFGPSFSFEFDVYTGD